MGGGSITAYRIPYLTDVPCAVLLVGQAAFSTAPIAVQRWTEVTVIAIWHEQEQMMDIGGMVTIFVVMGG